jgi:hypothetical protein
LGPDPNPLPRWGISANLTGGERWYFERILFVMSVSVEILSTALKFDTISEDMISKRVLGSLHC